MGIHVLCTVYTLAASCMIKWCCFGLEDNDLWYISLPFMQCMLDLEHMVGCSLSPYFLYCLSHACTPCPALRQRDRGTHGWLLLVTLFPLLPQPCMYHLHALRQRDRGTHGWLLLVTLFPLLPQPCMYHLHALRQRDRGTHGWLLLVTLFPLLPQPCMYHLHALRQRDRGTHAPPLIPSY